MLGELEEPPSHWLHAVSLPVFSLAEQGLSLASPHPFPLTLAICLAASSARGLLCTQQLFCPVASPGQRMELQLSFLGSKEKFSRVSERREELLKACRNLLIFLQTLHDMDSMLQTLLISPPASSLWDKLQRILQVCNLHSLGFTRGCPSARREASW